MANDGRTVSSQSKDGFYLKIEASIDKFRSSDFHVRRLILIMHDSHFQVRGLMSGIVSSLAYLFIFAIVKIYPNLMAWFQLWGMLALFSGVSVFTLVFVYFFLPETQGFSLIEIENNFRKGSKAEAVEPDPVYILRV